MNSLLTQGILIEFLVVLFQFMTSVFLFGNIMVWLHNDVEPMDNTETDRQTVSFLPNKIYSDEMYCNGMHYFEARTFGDYSGYFVKTLDSFKNL